MTDRYIVVSYHDGADGKEPFYRTSNEMRLEYAERRAKQMIASGSSTRAVLAKVEVVYVPDIPVREESRDLRHGGQSTIAFGVARQRSEQDLIRAQASKADIAKPIS